MEQELTTLLADPVSASGLFLESIEYSGGKYARLRVVVDLPDGPGGVSSDQLSAATRAISEVLDQHSQIIRGHYTLEVTTPGIGRTMTEERHFRRAVGRLVKVTTESGTFIERLNDVRDGVAVFENRDVSLAEITSAVQEIDMRKDA